jgi:hypothetical protein
MAKKAFSNGSAFSVFKVHPLFRSLHRREPRNDIHVIQRVGWTNVGENGIAERGADVYE